MVFPGDLESTLQELSPPLSPEQVELARLKNAEINTSLGLRRGQIRRNPANLRTIAPKTPGRAIRLRTFPLSSCEQHFSERVYQILEGYQKISSKKEEEEAEKLFPH